VQRRAAIPLGLVWLLTVLGTWALTTAALAALISAGNSASAIAGLVGQSAQSAALACVVVGGPATAVALCVRRRHGLGPAALAGLGVAALILVFIWSYMAASGTALRDTRGAVPPVLVVTVVQLGVAFLIRGRRAPTVAPEPTGAEPERAAAEPERAAAEPERAAAEAGDPPD
jgi:hypothetical protein